MLCEGFGIRAITRLTRLDKKTVNVLETAAEHCARLLKENIRSMPVNDVEIDELYGFVHCLQQNTAFDPPEYGDQYAFLAIEKNSKLILSWYGGKRDRVSAESFLTDVKVNVSGKFQITSDGLPGYSTSVAKAFGRQIDYGIEIKHFTTDKRGGSRRENPVGCQWVKRIPQLGNPDRSRMTVNHPERNNLSVRLFPPTV